MGDRDLQSYSDSEIENGVPLPENIQKIEQAVGKIEETTVETQLENSTSTYQELIRSAKEPVEICLCGSSAMYLLFESLREEGRHLQILEQRCQRGKNDLDFGVTPNQAVRVKEIWNLEEWVPNEDNHPGGHGKLKFGDTSVVVDLMRRPQLRGFEWQEVIYKGRSVKVQTPEEMFFEKVQSLARVSPESISPKWGIDAKLLSYYIMHEKGFESNNQLNTYLSDRWEQFLNSQNESIAQEYVNQRMEGETYRAMISRVLDLPQNELEKTLSEKTGYPIEQLSKILNTSSDEQFFSDFVELGKSDRNRMTYEQVSRKANEVYEKVVPGIS